MTQPEDEESPESEVRPPAPAVLEAVRASCRAVADRPVRLAEVFYTHLFEMVPGVRAMFPTDLTDQMQKMTDTLLGAIAELDTDDTSDLEVELHRLGARHRTRFGVEPEHYMYVGHALTRAVRDVAGAGYSGSLSSSWIAVYQWVAAHMMAGAEAAVASKEPRAAQPLPLAQLGPLPMPRRPAEDDLGSARDPYEQQAAGS